MCKRKFVDRKLKYSTYFCFLYDCLLVYRLIEFAIMILSALIPKEPDQVVIIFGIFYTKPGNLIYTDNVTNFITVI